MAGIFCGNCRKEIQADRYDIHESFCVRYNKYCERCMDAYDEREAPPHMQQHEEVKCVRCQTIYERRQVHDERDCRANMADCEFCENTYPIENLEEHTLLCGSRTERCPDCESMVQKINVAVHASECIGKLNNHHLRKEEQELLMEPNTRLSTKKQNRKTVDNSTNTISEQIEQISRRPTRKTSRNNIHKRSTPITLQEEDVYEISRTKLIKKPEPRETRPRTRKRGTQVSDDPDDKDLLTAIARSYQHQ